MTTLQEIVAAIEKLPASDRAKLDAILHSPIDDEWDKKMIADANAGKLDKVVAQVDANIEAGNLREIFRDWQTDPEFWNHFNQLPADVQAAAREKFALWTNNPYHSSLHFKELKPGLWSARINMQYRTLARKKGDVMVWYWIGTHTDYDRLIKD